MPTSRTVRAPAPPPSRPPRAAIATTAPAAKTKTTTPSKGKGRPTLATEDRKKRINIVLAAHHHKIAAVAGDKNVSAGIATALDAWASSNLNIVLK